MKIIIEASIFNSSFEREFAVVNPFDESILYNNDFPLRLKVGVKNVLSLSIEFDHSNYNCRGTLKGFVIFNLVNTNIKFMEIQLIRREIIFDGKKYEPEYIARYELVDGGPCRYERLPIRFFLKSYNLTPSYPDIEGFFGVKYFLNFVVVDGEDNRFFKFAEINLFRLFSDRKTHASNYDNNGLFISEPFFEDEYFYDPNSLNNKRNEINGDYYNGRDDYNEENNYMKNNINYKNDNNLVLNIPGEDYSNEEFNNNSYLRNVNNNNDFNKNNNWNLRANKRFDYDNNYNEYNNRYNNYGNNNRNNINNNQRNEIFNNNRNKYN